MRSRPIVVLLFLFLSLHWFTVCFSGSLLCFPYGPWCLRWLIDWLLIFLFFPETFNCTKRDADGKKVRLEQLQLFVEFRSTEADDCYDVSNFAARRGETSSVCVCRCHSTRSPCVAIASAKLTRLKYSNSTDSPSTTANSRSSKVCC